MKLLQIDKIWDVIQKKNFKIFEAWYVDAFVSLGMTSKCGLILESVQQ